MMKKVKITNRQRRENMRRFAEDYLTKNGKLPIEWSDKISEADICYELRKEIEMFGLIVKSEFTCITNIKNKKVRFDLSVFNQKKEILCNIEVKDSPGSNLNCPQFQKYRMFDCPLLLCLGHDDIEKCVDEVHFLAGGIQIKSVL